MITEFQIDIDSHYSLSEEQIAFYRENGYIKLKDVLSSDTLARYKEEIHRKTIELNTLDLPMEERDTYQKAFLQVINLWEHSDVVKEFVLGKRLARIAAELMEVDGVRLYHDQALFKEAKGGFTPWHADQQYWPLATEKTVTAWIPLQAVKDDMGPLSFAGGSQKETAYRDLEISDASEKIIGKAMDEYETDCGAFDLGEVSFHSGWTYHRAGANTAGKMRAVMTVIYMDEQMKLKEPENQNQQNDRDFCPGIEPGELCDSPRNPLIWKK